MLEAIARAWQAAAEQYQPDHQPNLNRPWTDVVSDRCTCSWINYSDNGGWYLKSADPGCPQHGIEF